jgi:hypothetical protein
MAIRRGSAAADRAHHERIPGVWQRILDGRRYELAHPDEDFRPYILEDPTDEEIERQREAHCEQVRRWAREAIERLEAGEPIAFDMGDKMLTAALRPPRPRIVWLDKLAEVMPEQVRVYPDDRVEPIYEPSPCYCRNCAGRRPHSPRQVRYIGYWAPEYYEERGITPGWLPESRWMGET